MPTPCETLRDQLIDIAKGETNSEAQAHLDTGCVTCAEELEQLRGIVAVLTRMPDAVVADDSRERVTAAAHAADWADTPEQTEAMVQVAGLLAALPAETPEAGFTQRVLAQAQVADLVEQLPTPQPSEGATKRVVDTAQVVDLLMHLPDPQPSEGATARVVAAALAADAAEPSLTDSGVIRLGDYMKERVRKAPIWAATIAVHAAAILVLASIAIAPRGAPHTATEVAVAPKDDPAKDGTDSQPEEDPAAGATEANLPLPGPAPVPLDPTLDERWDEFEDTEMPKLDPFGGQPRGDRVGGDPRFTEHKVNRELETERKIRTRVAAWIGSRIGANRTDAHSAAGTSNWQSNIDRGLQWLRENQQADGSWSPAKHGGLDDHRVGLTALAVLAFAAEGHSATDGTNDANVVSQAVKFLWRSQDHATGRFGPDSRTHLYTHALVMLAIGETHALDILNHLRLSDAWSRNYLKSGAAYLVSAQRKDGGWGYRPESNQSDTSITVWQIAALDAANRVGVEADGIDEALRLSKSWLQRVSDASGRFGYHKPGDFPKGAPALAAAGKWGQLLLSDAGRGADAGTRRAELLRKSAPSAMGKGNVYAWYYGTLVMNARGGSDWTAWRDALGKTLAGSQSLDGSWPAGKDRFGAAGGRLYTTAMNVLSLQAPARYSK